MQPNHLTPAGVGARNSCHGRTRGVYEKILVICAAGGSGSQLLQKRTYSPNPHRGISEKSTLETRFRIYFYPICVLNPNKTTIAIYRSLQSLILWSSWETFPVVLHQWPATMSMCDPR